MGSTKLEVSAAYLAATALGSPLKRTDKNASKLTIEKAESLICWANCHENSYFEDINGTFFSLQVILDLWHASIVYEDLRAWFEEDESANRTYQSICKKHGLRV